MRKPPTTYGVCEDKMVNPLKSLTGSESQPKRSSRIFCSIGMKERTNGRFPDMLSMYDQDVLLLSVPAVEEMLAVWGCLNHSFLIVLKWMCQKELYL